jgi:hypothetical protein
LLFFPPIRVCLSLFLGSFRVRQRARWVYFGVCGVKVLRRKYLVTLDKQIFSFPKIHINYSNEFKTQFA